MSINISTPKQDLVTILEKMSNHELTQSIKKVFHNERHLQADFILLLSEILTRRLHIQMGYSSLMVYCVSYFGLTEFSAYKRMQIARVAKKYPDLVEAIRARKMSLTVAAMIAPKLKDETASQQIRQCLGRSKDQVKKIIAVWEPQEDVKDSVRHMKPREKHEPARTPIADPAPAQDLSVSNCNLRLFFDGTAPILTPSTPREEIKPLSAERVSLRFSINLGTEEKLKRARELLGPSALADVFDRALDALLETKDPQRREARRAKKTVKKQVVEEKQATKPIPANVTPKLKDEVLARVGHQCSYVSPEGKRCEEKRRLELEHVKPRGKGGDHSDANLTILCKAHNLYRAQLHYGKAKMQTFLESRPPA
jgi:hypothetical protein